MYVPCVCFLTSCRAAATTDRSSPATGHGCTRTPRRHLSVLTGTRSCGWI